MASLKSEKYLGEQLDLSLTIWVLVLSFLEHPNKFLYLENKGTELDCHGLFCNFLRTILNMCNI